MVQIPLAPNQPQEHIYFLLVAGTPMHQTPDSDFPSSCYTMWNTWMELLLDCFSLTHVMIYPQESLPSFVVGAYHQKIQWLSLTFLVSTLTRTIWDDPASILLSIDVCFLRVMRRKDLQLFLKSWSILGWIMLNIKCMYIISYKSSKSTIL